MPRITVISDTHGWNLRTKFPGLLEPADILIHCGDMTSRGSIESLAKVGRELATLPFRYKVVIAGNHDRGLYKDPDRARAALYPYCIYLQDELIEIMGLRIYGSPWLPWRPERINPDFRCFNVGNTDEKWKQIPDHLDILVTHGPPYGILDAAPRDIKNHPDGRVEVVRENIGDPSLSSWYNYSRDVDVLPRYHVFGHNHSGYGLRVSHDDMVHLYSPATVFINASACNDDNQPVNEPYRVIL